MARKNVDEHAWELLLNLARRAARGSIACKSVQREAFQVLIEVKKLEPWAVADGDLKTGLIKTLEVGND